MISPGKEHTATGVSQRGTRAIRVVVFCGGPRLEDVVRVFLGRLERDPDIELVAVFCESHGRSLQSLVADRVRRRRLLALPILAAEIGGEVARWVRHPMATAELHRTIRSLSDRLHFVPDLHADAVVRRVRGLAPDLGLIYGGPILRSFLFEIPSHGTLGIHHGKLPAYRCKKTWFWAVYNGEATASVTIQKVEAGVDTGAIVLEADVPALGRRPGAVWRDLKATGIDLYLRAIREVSAGTATYRPQGARRGRLYREPRMRDLIVCWWRRFRGGMGAKGRAAGASS